MRVFGRRLRAGLAALLVLTLGWGAEARPIGLDDMLHAEDLGAVAIDPTGRWVVAERRCPYDETPNYDFGAYGGLLRSRLLLLDLKRPAGPRPLFPQESDAGYVAGPFSPNGQAMLVYRLAGRTWQAGIASPARGQVRWFALTPELSLLGRTAQWRSNRELLLLVREDLPLRLRWGWQAMTDLPRLWAASLQGRTAAATLVGSGRFLGVRPRAAVGRLVSLDVTTGAVRTLARGEYEDLELSPDGRWVAALALGEDLQAGPKDPIAVGTALRRRNLLLVDLATGRAVTPCPGCDLATHLLAWSPGSDAVLVYSRAPGAPWTTGRLLRLGVAGGAAAGGVVLSGVQPDLATTSEGITYVRAGWLGGDPIVFGRVAGAARADWYRLGGGAPVNLTGKVDHPGPLVARLPRDRLEVVGADGVWRVDRSGEAVRLAPGARGLRLPDLGGGDRARANDLGAALLALGASGQQITAAGGPAWTGLAPGAEPLAHGGRAVALLRADDHGVEALSVAQPGRAERTLLTLNAGFADLDVVQPQLLRHRDPAGRQVVSWLYRPAGAATGAEAPLVVLPYPGSAPLTPPRWRGSGAALLQNNPQVLAGHGYAVLVPGLPSDGRPGEPAAGLGDQILAAVDAAIAAGGVDPDRVAIWGHSFGGYAALVAASQGPRFKAVIAAAAPSDLVSVRGVLPPHNRVRPQDGLEPYVGGGWAELGQGGLGATPWADPLRYVRNSPLFAVEAITAPVLLVAGDQDTVSFTQSQEMFLALHRQAKDAQLLTFWGEGHILESPANLRRLYGEAFSFLDASFGRGPGPGKVVAWPAP